MCEIIQGSVYTAFHALGLISVPTDMYLQDLATVEAEAKAAVDEGAHSLSTKVHHFPGGTLKPIKKADSHEIARSQGRRLGQFDRLHDEVRRTDSFQFL